MKYDFSVVIPVYNSADIFPELYKRLTKTLLKLGITYEIIAVVDGNRDASSDVIAGFCKQDENLKLIEFSRNFGHQIAITAGLQYAKGEMVCIMDDDLEDPPEILGTFIEKAKAGYDVVYGIRRKRKVSLLRKLAFRLFYILLNKLSGIDMPPDAGDFCLMKRNVVDLLNSMPEKNRYIRGMRSWLGFNQIGIEYERCPRFKGKTGYSVRKYFRFAFDAFFSFSYKPLQYVSVVGVFIAFFSFVMGIRLIALKLLGKIPGFQGWVSIMVAIFFIGGIQIAAIGIVGQYVARIFDEVKNRPKFAIKRQIGFSGIDTNA